MDDLGSKINEIMSDPEKLREIQNLGKMMGLTGDSGTSSESEGSNLPKAKSQTGNTMGIDPNILNKLAPILANVNTEDDTTRLFDALVPFLSEERRERLEKIKKMMIIIRLLPNIKNIGLF